MTGPIFESAMWFSGTITRDAASVSSASSSPTSLKTRTDYPWYGVGKLTLDRSTGKGTGLGLQSPGGRWTYVVDFGGIGSRSATATVTMANGDKLFVKMVTTVVAGDRNRFTMTITGGTGGFAGAAGISNGEVQEQKVIGPNVATAVVKATVWFSGTITY